MHRASIARVTLGSEKSRCGRSGTIAFYRVGSLIFSLSFSLSITYSHAPRLRCLSASRPRLSVVVRMSSRRASWRSARSQHPLAATGRLVPFPSRVSVPEPSLFVPLVHTPLALASALCTRYIPASPAPRRVLVREDREEICASPPSATERIPASFLRPRTSH